jgi:3D (Asp-Asp-Asp) domain-containing protein
MGGNKMINKLKTFIVVAALSGTVGASVLAAEITEENQNTALVEQKNESTSTDNQFGIEDPVVDNIIKKGKTATPKIDMQEELIAKETKEPQAQEPQAQEPQETIEASNPVITVDATAYTASCEGCSGITKTGVNIKDNPEEKVIAVDPNVIPLGSEVYVEGYGYATAEDIGGAIDGNEIDVFIPTEQEAKNWGRKQVKVTIIN